MTPLEQGPAWLKWAGLFAGPLVAALVYALLPEAQRDGSGELVSGLTHAGRATAAIGALMAVWWLSEALPLEATSLVPLVLLPITGAASPKAAAAPYASEVIFLFMGGLILGLSMERWGLHARIALRVVRLVGSSPAMLIGGVMLATAAVSMWVSNTATAVMMLPIGTSVVLLLEDRLGRRSVEGGGVPRRRIANIGVCMMLGIAYASSIGGIGTLIGTPPNAIFAAVAREKGLSPEVGFAGWMLVCIPMIVVFLPLTWLILTRALYPVPRGRIEGLSESIGERLAGLGPMSRGEWATAAVFCCTATLWVLREPIGRAAGLIFTNSAGARVDRMTDAMIAMAGALALFLIPVDAKRRIFAMDWEHAAKLPWGVLLLFGGGLSLADAVSANRVDLAIGAALEGLRHLPVPLLVLAVAGVIVFLTEVASNTAVATVFLQIVHGVSGRLGIHPYTLMLPTATGASLAFMMPMGTPPNALVFATGRVSIRQMAGAGLVLNILSILLITAACLWWAPWVLGFEARPRP